MQPPAARMTQALLAPPPPFVLAAKFAGARRGMVFKRGDAGLGYYCDDGPIADGACASRDDAGAPGRLVLALDDLVPDAVAAHGCDRCERLPRGSGEAAAQVPRPPPAPGCSAHEAKREGPHGG